MSASHWYEKPSESLFLNEAWKGAGGFSIAVCSLSIAACKSSPAGSGFLEAAAGDDGPASLEGVAVQPGKRTRVTSVDGNRYFTLLLSIGIPLAAKAHFCRPSTY